VRLQVRLREVQSEEAACLRESDDSRGARIDRTIGFDRRADPVEQVVLRSPVLLRPRRPPEELLR
jgi:hypothetical protein